MPRAPRCATGIGRRCSSHLALWPRTIEEVPSLNRPLSKFADRALAAAWKKVAKQGCHTSELEGEARHKMRKSLKKLRYTVEYFGSLYGPRGVAPMRKRLKALQDIFGYVNDVRTAAQIEEISATYCPENSECQRAAGCVVGWHTAEAAHCWTSAAKDWKKLDITSLALTCRVLANRF